MSAPYTSEKNGLYGRSNRTMIQNVRCIFLHENLGLKYWAGAISTAYYLKNLTPTRVISSKIPCQEFMGKTVPYGRLRNLGCID